MEFHEELREQLLEKQRENHRKKNWGTFWEQSRMVILENSRKPLRGIPGGTTDLNSRSTPRESSVNSLGEISDGILQDLR